MHAPQTSCLHTGIRYWGPPTWRRRRRPRPAPHSPLRSLLPSWMCPPHYTTTTTTTPRPDVPCPLHSPPRGHTPRQPHPAPLHPISSSPPFLPPAQPPASLAIPLPRCTPASPSPSSWSRPCSGVPRPPTARLLLLGRRCGGLAPHRTAPHPSSSRGRGGGDPWLQLLRRAGARPPLAWRMLTASWEEGAGPQWKRTGKDMGGSREKNPEKRNPTMMIRSPQLPSNLLGRHCLNGRSTERGERDWRRTLWVLALSQVVSHTPFP